MSDCDASRVTASSFGAALGKDRKPIDELFFDKVLGQTFHANLSRTQKRF